MPTIDPQGEPSEPYIPEYDNAFIAGLPPIPTLKELLRHFNQPPVFSEEERRWAPEIREHLVLRLNRYSQATMSAITLGKRLDLAIRQGYIGRNPNTTDWMRGLDLAVENEEAVRLGHPDGNAWLDAQAPSRDSSLTFAVVGIPGAGKTHSCATALERYQQVLTHNTTFSLHQIAWLKVECPPSGSLKSLTNYFFAAVDTALKKAGARSRYEAEYKRATLDISMAGMVRVATLHAIGVVVIDEIQHVKLAKTGGSDILNFMVSLRNSIGIPVVLIGTLAALGVLQRTFRDARRGDGLGCVMFERMGEAEGKPGHYGPEFASFVTRMWQWQWTKEPTEISPELIQALYHQTQGVLDLVVKLFMLVQLHLIGIAAARPRQRELITVPLINSVATESFRIVRPFITALQNNNHEALLEFEDLVELNQWFSDYVKGIGTGSKGQSVDVNLGADEPAKSLTSGGTLSPDTLDIFLAGLNVPEERRQGMLASVADLIGKGDLFGVLEAIRAQMASDAARKQPSKRASRKRQQPLKGDVRDVIADADDLDEMEAELIKANIMGFGEHGG